MENTNDSKKYIFTAGSAALICVSILALVMSVSEWKAMSRGGSNSASITVSGEGEITATPDIATVTFTVRESAKTVPEAQKAAETKVKDAVKALSGLGVSDKDTKTLSYMVNPKYETQTIYCITVPCPQGKTTVTGYEVSETIQVKVRNIEKAGDVLGSLGTVNITEISGPEFTVDDIEKAQAEAKEKAIADAKEKAEKTADALGVSLGAVIQYSEDGGWNPYPVAYSMKAEAGDARGVTLPQGESVIKSHVTVTYSIN